MTRWIGITAVALALVGSACSEATPEAQNGGSVGVVSSTTASTSTSTTSTPAPETTVASPSTTLPSSYPVPEGEAAWVVSVTDGDTVIVTVQGIEERVRLIGINTPESGECLADEATVALEELIAGREVTLSVDVNDRDQYGRLLRYIWVDDLFVNEQMVETGLALARRYEPDTALADLLDAAQERAKEDNYGMWAPDACGARTDADVVIAEIQYDAPGNDNDNPNGEWVRIENR
jgi:endonuclease YncB( thermonuclease family)